MPDTNRVGMYLKPEARASINLLRAEMSMALKRTVSQSEAVITACNQFDVAKVKPAVTHPVDEEVGDEDPL